jgi:hypothetical protein
MSQRIENPSYGLLFLLEFLAILKVARVADFYSKVAQVFLENINQKIAVLRSEIKLKHVFSSFIATANPSAER